MMSESSFKGDVLRADPFRLKMFHDEDLRWPLPLVIDPFGDCRRLEEPVEETPEDTDAVGLCEELRRGEVSDPSSSDRC